MPKPRRLGATKTFLVEEYTTRSPTLISPARGRSRPAIERRVVVLPQPLGPSRVNSFPSGTSNVTSCAARTIWPRSFGYSVKRPATFSTRFSGSLLDSESLAQELGHHDQNKECQNKEHSQRRQLHVLAVLPQFPDGDRQDLGAGAEDHDRKAEHEPRKNHRQRGDVVEEPAPGELGLDDDPADDGSHEHDHRRAAEGKDQGVPHRAPKIRISEDKAVGVQGKVGERLP